MQKGGIERRTDEELLQLLVAIIDAELLEGVVVEDLEAVDVQDPDDGGAVLPPLLLAHLDHFVHTAHDPREQSGVDRLGGGERGCS